MPSSSSSSSSSSGTSDASSTRTYEHAGRQVVISVHQSSSGGHEQREVRVVVDGQDVDQKLLREHVEAHELESLVNRLIDDKKV